MQDTTEAAAPALLWDLEAITKAPLKLRTVRKRTTGWGAGRLEHHELFFYSHDWAEGEVVIHAYLALPVSDEPVPAIVMGTGDADSAAEFCRNHRVATVVIDRP